MNAKKYTFLEAAVQTKNSGTKYQLPRAQKNYIYT